MGIRDELEAALAKHDAGDVVLLAERDALLVQREQDQALIAQLRARIAELEAGQPPAPTTVFGTSVEDAASLARRDQELGRGAVMRVFYPGLPKAWPGKTGRVDRDIVVSFKANPRDVLAGKHDDALRTWFASAPTDVRVLWTYFHEPEDNIAQSESNAADYRAAWARLRAIQRDAAPALRSCLVLMAWSLDPRAKRDWHDYYPGDDVIDVLGWDAYSADKAGYSPPANVFGRCVETSRGAGKPFGFAEWGSLRVAGDDGTRRAAWMRECAAYHREVGAVFSSYFDSSVGGDYRLTDEPSKQAMRDILAQTH